jgi:hypothetical protein
VHDLVAVAAQQELLRGLERGEQRRQLHRGEVLHLVHDHDHDHDHEVVPGGGQRSPLVRHQVGIEQSGLYEPLAVALEEPVRGLARRRRQQALVRAQCQVVLQS